MSRLKSITADRPIANRIALGANDELRSGNTTAAWVAALIDDVIYLSSRASPKTNTRRNRVRRGLYGMVSDINGLTGKVSDTRVLPGMVLLVDRHYQPAWGLTLAETMLDADGLVARKLREIAVSVNGDAAWLYKDGSVPWLDRDAADAYLVRLRTVYAAAAAEAAR